MADQYPNEGSSTSNISGGSSDATVEINIKTLDSQIYSFRVEKDLPVSAFKEKIANEIGVPVGQQRLIFRGRVLKDEHLLSDYQVENGHTLHLVPRQPAQPQPSADTSSGDTSGNNGNDASAGGPRNRVGQMSHSVVLGTFNVGDQGEGIVPDLSRVIGAVLNSFGVGGQTVTNGVGGMQFPNLPNVSGMFNQPNVSGQAPHGNETGRPNVNPGGQSQPGNQTQGQAFPSQPFQPSPHVMQIPQTTAIPVPSLHSPIPDSLTTLSEFMTRMEQALTQIGYQPPTSSTSIGNQPRVELPHNERGLPTPEALSIVLRHAERLGAHTISALSHIAGRLEQERASSDPTVRGQIQTESMQLGLAVQHLGALFLELGRLILTLRMGQSPAESSVNPGPAVYISPSGPNPIMVQPFPLQTHSLFGGSVPPSNPFTFGSAGAGTAARNINIHIHAGTSLAPVVSTLGTRAGNAEGMQGERGNVTGISSVLAEINSRLRNVGGNMQGENQATSSVESGLGNDTSNEQDSGMATDRAGGSSESLPRVVPETDGPKTEDEHVQLSDNKATEVPSNSEDVSSCSTGSSSGETSLKSQEASKNAPSSSKKHDLTESAKAVPLGLGLGSLERKRQIRQPKSVVRSGDNEMTNTPSDQNPNARTSAQQLLQNLTSRSSGASRELANDSPSQVLPSDGRAARTGPLREQGSNGQFDAASVMSQVIQSPALDGLLTGFSDQTGVGSPDVLRGMLQQLSQNPQIMSTVSQIAQQVENQDLGNMFSGLGSSQGGGIDLSRMVQQMMPVVSQVLGRGPVTPETFPTTKPETQMHSNEREARGSERTEGQNNQINVEEVARRIERFDPPGDVFHAVVDNAVRLNGNGSISEDIVQALSNNDSLVRDYMEMLQRDLRRRLQGDSEQKNL